MPEDLQSYLVQAKQNVKDAGMYYYYPLQRGDPETDSTASNIYELAKMYYQNDYNANQAELSFNRQRDLINEQNEYNSPANQMARYMDAGLNPSVIYGQIGNGNQSNIAEYAPQRAADANLKESSRTEKFSRVMQTISTLSDILRTGASLAGQIEGVRNQSLQNEILSAQVPFERRIAQDRYNYYVWPERRSEMSEDDWKQFREGILYPTLNSYRYSGYKGEYQDKWNDEIFDFYKSQMQGKATSAEQKAAIDKYTRAMLESMPPAMRPYMMMFFQMMSLFK